VLFVLRKYINSSLLSDIIGGGGDYEKDK